VFLIIFKHLTSCREKIQKTPPVMVPALGLGSNGVAPASWPYTLPCAKTTVPFVEEVGERNQYKILVRKQPGRVGSCENGNELPGSIIGGEFLDQLSDC
jgi:hypothetical protein